MLATLPALVLLTAWVVPALNRIQASQDEIAGRLSRLEERTALIFFSRNPAGSSLKEALDHLRYWGEQEEIGSHPRELELARNQQELARQAILGMGRSALEALEEAALDRRNLPGIKYYRRNALRILARVDADRAATVAEAVLLDPTYPTQSRIFAAIQLLETARSKGVAALRRVVADYSGESMKGYGEMVGLYVNRTTDPARGRMLLEILRRTLVTHDTLLVVIKGVGVLPAEDPKRDRLADLLVSLYLRRNLGSNFRAATLHRPIMTYHRREILRALGEVMAPEKLGPFLKEAQLGDSNPGIQGLIRKLLREKCS